MNPETPAALLASAYAADPARPFLTYYDDGSGERVELSLATLDNWVAKTANFLQDGLGTEPGERVTIELPPHWYTGIWMLAAWSAGLVVDLDQDPDPEVAVTGPDTLAGALDAKARDVVALALRPLGGPFAEPLPAGVWDYGAEVPAYADRFTAYAPVTGDLPALVHAGVTRTHAELVEAARTRAAELELAPGARLLTDANPAAYAGCLDALLVPLALPGSVVLVRNLDPARASERQAAENVDRSLLAG